MSQAEWRCFFCPFLMAWLTTSLAAESKGTGEEIDELLGTLDVYIPDSSHAFLKELHPHYIGNLKETASYPILLVHDLEGNLHDSTYHYLGLKVYEIYEIISNFMSTNNIRQTSHDEDRPGDIMYMSHRNMMRHTLGCMTLEFYMTLLYKSRQDVLQRLQDHHPNTTRRDILQYLQARSNFDRQFNSVMVQIRQLLTEQSVYSEKSFYWNTGMSPDDAAILDRMERAELTNFLEIQNYQNILCENLSEMGKLLKAKRKFYVKHILPMEIAERRKQMKNLEEDPKGE